MPLIEVVGTLKQIPADTAWNWKDICQLLFQLLGTFVAAYVVIWSVGKQREGSLLLQKENIKEKFKAKLHGEIEKKLQKLSDASVEAGGIKLMLNSAFIMQQAALAQGYQPAPLPLHLEQFNNRYNKVSNYLIAVIIVIEKYEIVQPEIKIFQTALNVALHDLREAYSPLVLELMRVLPSLAPNGATVLYKPLATPAQIAVINNLTAKYEEATGTITCYVHDFRIEIQNLLLGKLFGNHVPARLPLDPRNKVIKTDEASILALTTYFEEATAWGRNKRETEERVRRELAGTTA